MNYKKVVIYTPFIAIIIFNVIMIIMSEKLGDKSSVAIVKPMVIAILVLNSVIVIMFIQVIGKLIHIIKKLKKISNKKKN